MKNIPNKEGTGDEMNNTTYYCPDCDNKLEKVTGCASVSYFCDTCKKVISRSRIVSEENRKEK